MSRLERYGRRRSQTRAQRTLSVEDQSTKESAAGELPPRNNKHRSTKQQLTKLYYQFLIVFFIGLVAGLLIYGYGMLDNRLK